MPNIKTIFTLSCVLSTTLLLSACNKDQPPTPNNQRQDSSVNNSIGELNQTSIKQFPATPDDGHDIAILEDYDQRFTSMSDSMEIELAKMKEANTLTPEFEQQRQKDNIHSALTMLKELELKTEQGRYIQGLLSDYWQNQAKVLEQSTSSGTTTTDTGKQVDQLKQYLHAQSQLNHWKSSQTADSKMQQE